MAAGNSLSLAWVTVADRSLHSIRTWQMQEVGPYGFRLSDDGAWIAYVSEAAPDSPDRHIHVMSASGQQDSEAVGGAGNNSSPIWTPDGLHLLFLSDRAGTRALCSVPVQNGTATADPSVVQSNFTGTPLRMVPSGSLYYMQSGDLKGSVFVAERAPGGTRVIQTFPGSSPAISPDGKWVVFTVGPDEFRTRSIETGVERPFKHAGVGAATGGQYLHNRWLPDSSGLIVWVTEAGDAGQSGGSFYRVDAMNGTFTRMAARRTDGQLLSRAGAVSADGRTFYVLAKTDQGPYSKIVALDIPTGTVKFTRPLAGKGVPEVSIFSLALSPDDSMLAILADSRLLTVSTGSGTIHEIATKLNDTTRYPDTLSWTPNGQAILFSEVRNGAWRVMRIGANGGPAEEDGLDMSRLTGTVPLPAVRPDYGTLGGVSRDGSRIVFAGQPKPAFDLWALENVLSVLNKR
jgi:Tol biopolymer transport system component